MSREQFEAWARPLWRHREDFDQLIGAAPGTYNNYEVQAAWVAWQESARLKQEACAALVEERSKRSRTVRAAINGRQPEPCEYAAAIRAMKG